MIAGEKAMAAVAERSHADVLPHRPLARPGFRDNANPNCFVALALAANTVIGFEAGAWRSYNIPPSAR
jgi:hypothetical protein